MLEATHPINTPMLQTERGKVIDAKSMTDLGQIQNERNKLPHGVNEALLPIIDAAMSKDFEWVYSGVGKTERALRGIYYHSATGYLFRAQLDESFYIDSWADSRVHWSSGRDPIDKVCEGRGVSVSVKDDLNHDTIQAAIAEIDGLARICYAGLEMAPTPVATPVAEKIKKASSDLKSADHVIAIMKFVNEDDTVKDFVWRQHQHDEGYDEVPLGSRTRSLGNGMVMVEQGGYDFVPNGKKLYASKGDFWKHIPLHWPRFPLTKAKHWRRDVRTKDGDAIVRVFDLLIYGVSASTREVDNKIVSIELVGLGPHDGTSRPRITLKEKKF